MLVHFERWSHRYDEWIYWDSNRLRPLERPALRKEGLKDDEEFVVSGTFILSQTFVSCSACFPTLSLSSTSYLMFKKKI